MLLTSVARAIKQRSGELQQATAMDTIIQIAAQVQKEYDETTPTEPLILPAHLRQQAPDTTPANQSQPQRHIHIGELNIDTFRHEVKFKGKALHMTRIEYALLHCLAESQGRVLTYSEIVRHTHGQTMDDSEALLLLKQHIRNVRSKIPSDYLVNVRSTGYMLVDPNEVEE
jgi:DNA-binding response OmpR family regulator